MAPSGKRFAARDFLSVIDRIEEATPLVLEGLAKADPDDAEFLLFEPSGTCKRWLKLPLSIIESIESIGRYDCGDHSHPLVRLVFAAPTTPEAAAYAALAGYIEELAQMIARSSARPAVQRLQAEPGVVDDAGIVETCEQKCRRLHPDNWLLRKACEFWC